jgi:hypothetical protein
MKIQDILRERESVDRKVNEAMAAIRSGADSVPGLTRLLWKQRELNELLPGNNNA